MSKAKQILEELLGYYESVQKMASESEEIKNRILSIKEAVDELKEQDAKSCEGCASYDEDQYLGDCEECSLRYKSMFKLKAT